ncbi:hypothetical protein AVEN_170827-1 [Araneus ventricosus]|uniref:Uncharacterized protein n=1 Tax=Araneus ventricosus TaxID=182803 RepID=A0A4Y2U3S5_ARAVE|nr:hypothetical protein AVEN_34732-1 [Araneus ventricosus]GBO07625.1 hypothetical protein AVEN_170827-1 [Araneus ventricosus]
MTRIQLELSSHNTILIKPQIKPKNHISNPLLMTNSLNSSIMEISLLEYVKSIPGRPHVVIHHKEYVTSTETPHVPHSNRVETNLLENCELPLNRKEDGIFEYLLCFDGKR